MLKLFKTRGGAVAFYGLRSVQIPDEWDALLARSDLDDYVRTLASDVRDNSLSAPEDLLPPIASQEVWAAGVTFARSREAREKESAEAGASFFYEKIYGSVRPELFLKATPHRVVGYGSAVNIRSDSNWNVPEAELVAYISGDKRLVGFTIGNDMSSRDIERENPLYLPQAKIYDNCCSLGPCILISRSPPPIDTLIELTITRRGRVEFEDSVELASMNRRIEDLIEFLFADNSFPHGVFLMLGTGIVPPDDFTLLPGDEITIRIEPIGVLSNVVATKRPYAVTQ